MYTEPKIITSSDLQTRSYVLFYFNGERHREYNGKNLNQKIYPNKATTIKDRSRLLRKLLFEFGKALEGGWEPIKADKEKTISLSVKQSENPVSDTHTTQEVFLQIKQEKTNSPLSKTYKRDIKKICDQFLAFLTDEEKNGAVNKLLDHRIESFLNQFKKSGTYYMNKRRVLGVYFSELKRKRYIPENIVRETPKLKAKATLHEVYQKDQIIPILNFLKVTYPNLYLCCLLAYGCLLRPHEETRLLQKKNFNTDVTKITLSGSENKGGRNRVVYIPFYLKVELVALLNNIHDPESNIFTGTIEPYAESYFNTQWSRCKKKIIADGLKLLQDKQTIYSFRHSAAVDIYTRTKDIYLLQQLLGHSDMIVTIKYLRGLGVGINDRYKDIHPEL